MKIYTKTGDDGTTGLIGGSRATKADPLIGCVGSLDELNAALGWLRVVTKEWPLDFFLARIQNLLFEVGAEIASPDGHKQSHKANLGTITEDLERSIDMQSKILPELKQFILPGGSEMAARVHLVRASCRRAERKVVSLSEARPVRAEILAFLNRLSDWLFIAARTANADSGYAEPVWTKSD
ncbi:MAG: cob(I)yrinic acid a,c-diamide adenosyltransferase [Armatimonadetes bacterium]|nr:cob(I)yrinic acid a,c-diamide adenosyltransferase [Armatimonadota bacterium]